MPPNDCCSFKDITQDEKSDLQYICNPVQKRREGNKFAMVQIFVQILSFENTYTGLNLHLGAKMRMPQTHQMCTDYSNVWQFFEAISF